MGSGGSAADFEKLPALIREEAFLNFVQQSMQLEQDFHLSLWAIASGTCFA
jgi:hypothetical protein